MASPVTNSEWLAWVARLVSARPDQRCAPAYPADQFHCLLDELPWHLVPQSFSPSLRSLAERREGFVFNPACEVLCGTHLPQELSPQYDTLQGFARQGAIAWVRKRRPDSLSPFWLGPRLEQALSAPAGTGVASLSDQDWGVVIAAGILLNRGDAKDQEERENAALARAAEMFSKRNYAPVRSLIHPFHVAALRRYYRYLVRNGKIHLGDGQSARRYVAHNDGVARFFHQQIASTVSAIVGEPVKPSYVYLAAYLSGAALAKHTDREQCEFSVTMSLDFSPEPVQETPWPIRLDTPQGTTAVFQGLGDGLVYRGTRVPHYRDRLPEAHTSTSLFFHYVPLDFSGPLH
jgi:hypothetical protein